MAKTWPKWSNPWSGLHRLDNLRVDFVTIVATPVIHTVWWVAQVLVLCTPSVLWRTGALSRLDSASILERKTGALSWQID